MPLNATKSQLSITAKTNLDAYYLIITNDETNIIPI